VGTQALGGRGGERGGRAGAGLRRWPAEEVSTLDPAAGSISPPGFSTPPSAGAALGSGRAEWAFDFAPRRLSFAS
jgi:hypothetical protein